jgi:hypothetical protein
MDASKAISTLFAMRSHLLSVNHATVTTSPQFKQEPSNKNEFQVTKVEIKKYQVIVDFLIYAMLCTHLNLAYAIQQLSQFNSNPTTAHFQATKRVFRYLQGIQMMGLTYYNDGITNQIHSYCDIDYAMDRDRKLISGMLFTFIK